MSRVATAIISINALKHNLSIVRQAAPQSKILAVIKANAYGHGMLTVAAALQEVDAFAVAHVEGAEVLRQHYENKPIVLLQGFSDEAELALLFSLRIEPVIHSMYQVDLLETFCLSKKCPVSDDFRVWLKIESSMNRLGVPSEKLEEIWSRLNKIPQLKNNIQLMSHFANADDVNNSDTQKQIELFNQVTLKFHTEKSLANSAGLMAWPSSHYQWVRPGIMLYGVSPFLNKQASDHDLKPVMTFQTTIIAINELKKSEAVGYGSNWQAEEDTQIAVISCGYGDGYPRHIANGTLVLINDQYYPIVGTVSMDMICVDIGLPKKGLLQKGSLQNEEPHQINIGDSVTLWGDGLPVEQIASKAGTIAYELLCQVTSRVNYRVVD